jgi:hypothetical protein
VGNVDVDRGLETGIVIPVVGKVGKAVVVKGPIPVTALERALVEVEVGGIKLEEELT